MSFEMAQAQYDAMEPPDLDECPVCDDECELAAAFAFADDRIKGAKEEPEHYRSIL